MTTASPDSASKPLGVIDAIGHGFSLINRHPWLLLIPLLVDLLLWQAPRLSVANLVNRQIDFLFNQPDLPVTLPADSMAMVDSLRGVGANFNLLSLLAGPITRLPSYLARTDVAAAGAMGRLVPIESLQQVFLTAILLIPVGLLIGSLWLALTARAMENEPRRLGDILRRTGWVWLNIGLYVLGLVAAVLAASGLFGLVIFVIVALTGTAGLTIASVVWLLMVAAIVWVSIGLSFVVSAIVLDRVNVARATWRSFNVVGRNLPSTLGLLILSLILSEGFVRIWLRLSTNAWGVPIGVLGNAYIGAGLTAATLFFYRARYQQWQRVRSTVASARKPNDDGMRET